MAHRTFMPQGKQASHIRVPGYQFQLSSPGQLMYILGGSSGGSSTWVPGTQQGDTGGPLGSWFEPGPVLAVTDM